MHRWPRVPWLAVFLVAVLAPAVSAQSTPPRRLTILLANDDGYDAPGLRALVDTLAPLANLVIAAPAVQQSGTGHGITYRDPIVVRTLATSDSLSWYAIDARPATCVRLALEALMTAPPDLVISGINAGENVGLSAWVSGTVAAAREAAFFGIPAIAVSLEGRREADYRAAAHHVRELLQQMSVGDTARRPMLLNVNVPAGVADSVRGVRAVHLDLTAAPNRYERRVSPRGVVYFWDAWRPPESEELDTDTGALALGYITITPLLVDQTDYARLDSLSAIILR